MPADAFSFPAARPPATFAPRMTRRTGVPWPVSTLLLWQDRARMRGHLAAMPAERLLDAGLTPAMRDREAAKPFWRA